VSERIDARSFTVEGTASKFSFGVDAKRAAAELRRIADEIEASRILVASVEVSGSAVSDGYLATRLTLSLWEQVAPKEGSAPPRELLLPEARPLLGGSPGGITVHVHGARPDAIRKP
jgi:hypothetical protein